MLSCMLAWEGQGDGAAAGAAADAEGAAAKQLQQERQQNQQVRVSGTFPNDRALRATASIVVHVFLGSFPMTVS